MFCVLFSCVFPIDLCMVFPYYLCFLYLLSVFSSLYYLYTCIVSVLSVNVSSKLFVYGFMYYLCVFPVSLVYGFMYYLRIFPVLLVYGFMYYLRIFPVLLVYVSTFSPSLFHPYYLCMFPVLLVVYNSSIPA